MRVQVTNFVVTAFSGLEFVQHLVAGDLYWVAAWGVVLGIATSACLMEWWLA